MRVGLKCNSNGTKNFDFVREIVREDMKGHCNSYGFLGGLSAVSLSVPCVLQLRKEAENE